MTIDERVEEAYWENPNFNRTQKARELGIDAARIRKIIRKLKGREIKQNSKPIEERLEFNHTSKTAAKLDLESMTITSLEQALEVARVDLTQWKVDRYTIGSWQVTLKQKLPTGEHDKKGNMIYRDKPKTVTMYKIQVWLKRLQNMEWVEAIKLLIKDIPKLKIPKKRYFPESEYLLEIALMDVHFGMLAWGKESGFDYDLDIAENLFLYAVDDMLIKTAPYNPARIIFPFGNDYMHIDDPTNATPQNRNPLDVDSRLIKIYQKAKLAAIKAINRCREVAPVDILWIPGNHDPSVSYYMCDAINEIFRNDKDVTVDISPKARKYYPWGSGLIAFTHGVDEPLKELPGIMATEEPKLWGDSKYREIHVGHKHKKMEMRWISVDTQPGAVVRMIPSIACADNWHYRRGFIRAYHAAESYLWDKRYGMIGQFTSFIDYKD